RRLPPRSAVVAFSMDEVYALAERLRAAKGGAAVVLGALSPRTRNAQVALYQSGDVDYLVATDAIGMGLNLDVDHVAFASDRKFDGYQFRKLNPAELAQIAGRAGRATRDGTFGVTGRCDPFDPELVQALESHVFEPVRMLQWRNTDLDFSSIGALQASLAMLPREQGLTRAPIAEDIQVLDHAARDEDVRALAKGTPAIERLWDVCQVPDYRKIAPATHAELAVTLYGFLMRDGNIPVDWFARQVAHADRTDGDIDTLSNRIAHVRTWTFVANRPDWLADPEHWQDVTRAVEDKLSDALHERLSERFVDRRTSVLMRRLRENTVLETEIGKSGEVTVEGHVIGRLDGFMFAPDAAAAGSSEARALNAAGQKALAGEIEARATKLSQAPNEQIVLANDGMIRWSGEAVGKLVAGDDTLRPRVRIVADEHLTGPARELVQNRLDVWLKTYIEKVLAQLFSLSAADDITGMARGVAFQLVEALGVLERQKVSDEVKGLDQPARATLRKYGVRFGAYHIYLPQLLKPAPRALATQLWALKHEPNAKGVGDLLHLAASGRTSIPVDKDAPKPLYRTAGYRVTGERAVRVDILERLADLIRPALSWREGMPGEKPAGWFDGRGFTVTGAMTSLTGASGEDFASILRSLGYRMDRKPKPAQAPAAPAGEAVVTEATPPAETSTSAGEVTAPVPVTAPVAVRAASSLSLLPSTDFMPVATAPVVPVESASPPVTLEPAPVVVAAAVAPIADTQPAASAEVMPTEASNAEDAVVEVWRPAGRSEHRPRPKHQRHQRRDQRPATLATQPVTGETSAPSAEATAGAKPTEQGERPDQRRRDFGDKRADRADRHDRAQRRERQDRRDDRNDRGGERKFSGKRRERGSDVDRADRERYFAHQGGRADRKEADPNSPFAKLAALKQQLESAKGGD
ncbi:MAG: helicase, partial [Pseudolabrys sp.]|nr:helicase [Pseudolabrys sp.]